MVHIPVLKNEVLKYSDPKPNENFIDCTIGEGGHTLAILEKNKPNGKVLGLEIDPQLYETLKASEIKNRLILVNDSFVNLKEIVEKYNFKLASGILFDLGISSWHLEKSKRGFSFLRDEPLMMRYDGKIQNYLTAEKIVNGYSESEIERILKEYGQERFAKRISKEICRAREINKIKSTFQLIKIIKRAVPVWYQHKKIHFATKTFQALRITVNDELNNLEKTLPQALEILVKEGRLVVISFHSLEDRIVKNFFRKESQRGQLKILTKKPIRPSKEEIIQNPCSRSARLRAAIKTWI